MVLIHVHSTGEYIYIMLHIKCFKQFKDDEHLAVLDELMDTMNKLEQWLTRRNRFANTMQTMKV